MEMSDMRRPLLGRGETRELSFLRSPRAADGLTGRL